MLARAHTFTIEALQTRHVTVEVDIRPGLPGFTIVGLADAAVREARQRVQSAIINSGYEFPAQPDHREPRPRRRAEDRAGPRPRARLRGAGGQRAAAPRAVAEPRAVRRAGTRRRRAGLSAGHARRRRRQRSRPSLRTLVLAPERAREALLVEGLEVAGVERLSSAVRVLGGGPPDALPEPAQASRELSESVGTGPERRARPAPRGQIADRGGRGRAQQPADRAAGHRQDDARPTRSPRSCPPLSPRGGDRGDADPQHRGRIWRAICQAAGRSGRRITRSRPPGLIGGARRGWVGEIVLAHNGVLFLDELSEFARPTLEALRQPLEDGRVAIVRAGHSAVYPSRFMLVAATNPCPCGYAGDWERCRCSETELTRHRRRLSGPLLDRIDLLVKLESEGAPASVRHAADELRRRRASR